MLLAMALASLSGCFSLFKPAKPAPPTESSGQTHIQLKYGTVEETLSTLALGIGAKGQGNGLDAYIGAFANPETDGIGFTTVFDPEVRRRFESQGGTVPNWDREYEKRFYSALIDVNSNGYTMVWGPYEEHGADEIAEGTAVIHRRYTIYLIEGGEVTDSRVAIGIADLTLKLISNRWLIVNWEDHVDPAVGIDPIDTEALCFSRRRLENQ